MHVKPTAPTVTLAALALTSLPAPAFAELPGPVRSMIDAAIASGDAEKVKTVVELAAQTNPDDTEEIAALHNHFLAQRKRLAAAEAQRKHEALKTAGLFENWNGKGEIGATRSTGNSREIGLTAALSLARLGIDWRHKLKAAGSYRRTNGATSREQYLLSYEPNYTVSDRLFAFGLAQYESDRIQGYFSRISVSGGLGYRVIDKAGTHLSLQAGPAWRQTRLVPSGEEENIAGLGALAFDWRFAENLKLTEDASAYVQSGNSTFTSATGLEAKIIGDLAARVSYSVEHDTDPPAGAIRTDTLSRVTLIYDF